jgi:hypothetical protein
MYDIFDIREYVGTTLTILKESNTQWKVTCPSCNGKMVVNKNQPKYMCVTEYCTPIEIRNAMGVYTYNPTNYTPSFSVSPLYIKRPLSLIRTEKKVDSTTQQSKNYIENKTLDRTPYYYPDNCKVVRYDIYVNGSRINKEFRPYKDNKIISYCDLKLYRENYLNIYGDYIWVEGEKCVDAVVKRGYTAITAAGGVARNKDYIQKRLLVNKPKIAGLVIIPDNDTSGIKKAALVEECAWRSNIPTKKINLDPFLSLLDEGDDVVDLLDLGYTLEEIVC